MDNTNDLPSVLCHLMSLLLLAMAARGDRTCSAKVIVVLTMLDLQPTVNQIVTSENSPRKPAGFLVQQFATVDSQVGIRIHIALPLQLRFANSPLWLENHRFKG